MKKITIQGIADVLKERDYKAKGLTPPDEAELLRIAEGLYQSSKENGPDNHIGTAKQKG